MGVDHDVKDLGLAWFADYRTNQNQHGSPLYIDGVLYVSTARNVVHAFDARDGSGIAGACVDYPKAEVSGRVVDGSLLMLMEDLVTAYDETLVVG